MKFHTYRLQWTPLIALIALIAGCTTERSPVTGEKEYYGFSWEQEKQLGKEADMQISQQLGLYDDAEVQRYVEEVGERVLSSSDFAKANLPERYRDTDFTFRVLDSSTVNAFALPGGYVYVTRGLLAHVENEAQLAVVLGHEIGHVAGRHSAQRALSAQWSQLGLMAGVLVGSEVLGREHTRDLLGVGGTVMQLLLNKYSREHEREADSLGVRYAAQEGYAAAEGAGFFRTLDRMAQSSGSRIPSWQSTHPEPAEREETIISLARRLSPEYEMNVVNTEDFHRHIDNLVIGEDPRQGFVENGTFLHPDLQFQFNPPSNWKLQNETQVVLMVDPRQQALMAFELSPASTPREAATELLAPQEGGQQLRVIRHGETRINGHPAYVVEAQAQTQNGTIALMDTFISYNNRVYSILGYTQANQYASYRNLFERTAESFNELAGADYMKVEPYRLDVQRANRTAPFRTFVPDDLPQGMDARDVAIMNQVQLDDVISRGDWLKIPRRG